MTLMRMPSPYMMIMGKIISSKLMKLCKMEVDSAQPLYTGATITLMESMLLILVYAMKHQLTGVALVDLLTLNKLALSDT